LAPLKDTTGEEGRENESPRLPVSDSGAETSESGPGATRTRDLLLRRGIRLPTNADQRRTIGGNGFRTTDQRWRVLAGFVTRNVTGNPLPPTLPTTAPRASAPADWSLSSYPARRVWGFGSSSRRVHPTQIPGRSRPRSTWLISLCSWVTRRGPPDTGPCYPAPSSRTGSRNGPSRPLIRGAAQRTLKHKRPWPGSGTPSG
jgi:hypothetical protein